MSKKTKQGFLNFAGLTTEEKAQKCQDFFEKLCMALAPEFEKIGSINKDTSVYLVPAGTGDQITYAGKPVNSFRISDHWNWKSSLKKNPNDNYVQCYTKDLPSFRNRREEGKASLPIWAWQIGYFDTDQQYHCIYGERFDRKTRTWYWIETDISEVIAMAKGALAA